MDKPASEPIVILLAIGLLLVVCKVIYLFFDAYGILDAIVFFVAGFTASRTITTKRPMVRMFLALPAFALSLFIVFSLGYTSIVQGVGLGHAVSLLVIPLATYIGIVVGLRHSKRKSA